MYPTDRMERTVQIPVSDETLAALRRDAEGYAAEIRLAAAAKLYELGRVSQEVAARVAGLSRREFMVALGSLGVSPFQDTPESLASELERG